MYLDDIGIYALGSIGIMAFIALAGFTEGGNYLAAVLSMVIMIVTLGIAVRLDRKQTKKR